MLRHTNNTCIFLYDVDPLSSICIEISSFCLLNQPSISVPNLRSLVTISRTITNVGVVDVVYHVAV
jgi:hypothetical protein